MITIYLKWMMKIPKAKYHQKKHTKASQKISYFSKKHHFYLKIAHWEIYLSLHSFKIRWFHLISLKTQNKYPKIRLLKRKRIHNNLTNWVQNKNREVSRRVLLSLTQVNWILKSCNHSLRLPLQSTKSTNASFARSGLKFALHLAVTSAKPIQGRVRLIIIKNKSGNNENSKDPSTKMQCSSISITLTT